MNPHPRYQDKQRYVRIEHDGSSFTSTPTEATCFLQEADDPSAYAISEVWMTPHEFESMPEFQGF